MKNFKKNIYCLTKDNSFFKAIESLSDTMTFRQIEDIDAFIELINNKHTNAYIIDEIIINDENAEKLNSALKKSDLTLIHNANNEVNSLLELLDKVEQLNKNGIELGKQKSIQQMISQVIMNQ